VTRNIVPTPRVDSIRPVVEAQSAGDVAEILSDHPFLSRGGTLQINEPAPI
jgi:hypothetical protein